MRERWVGNNPFLRSIQEYLVRKPASYTELYPAEITEGIMGLKDSDIGKLLAFRAIKYDGRKLIGEAEDIADGLFSGTLDAIIDTTLKNELSLTNVSDNDLHDYFQSVDKIAVETAKITKTPYLAGAQLILQGSKEKPIAQATVFWPNIYGEMAKADLGWIKAVLDRRGAGIYGLFFALHLLNKVPSRGLSFVVI